MKKLEEIYAYGFQFRVNIMQYSNLKHPLKENGVFSEIMLQTPLINIRKELNCLSHKELSALCIRLIRYKKENKELADYYLFEKNQEHLYLISAKEEIRHLFAGIQSSQPYLIKKSIRKIIRLAERYSKYSANPIIFLELYLEIMQCMLEQFPHWKTTESLIKIALSLEKKSVRLLPKLHEDLQFDYNVRLEIFRS